ncbi:MAG: AbrB/MazE/SpoVT family DNA-binding domain-containing protein [Elusimicrobiota bacterium]
MQTWSSHVGVKFQVTLPKHVRKALGITQPGELVGFLVDGSRITLTKAEITPQADALTEAEWGKLVRLAKCSPKKTSPAKRFLARHKRLTRG